MTQKIGFLFPGQGAQYVGMGKEWVAQFDSARRIFQEADQALGFPISQYCFDGPEETLTRTLYAQPAIFVTSLAFLKVLQERFSELKPDFTAGLSLGEFTSLVAAGSLSFVEGLKLVKIRAELMERAAQNSQGTMISILGLSQEACSSIAKESEAELANLNAPDQFVLSGKVESVERAVQLAEAKGAKKVIRLKVGGAFHSALMKEAKRGFQEALKKISLQAPKALFVPNATALGESDPERIRTLLGEQLTSPVRWIETMRFAKERGITRFLEIGPGKVLKGLARKIDPAFEVLSLEKVSDLESVESRLALTGK